MASRTMILFLLMVIWPCMLMAKADLVSRKVGVFKGWETYQTRLDGHLACYMILRPIQKEYNPLKMKNDTKKVKSAKPSQQPSASSQRDNVYMMITFRPDESMNPVVSYRAGYNFKQNSEAVLSASEKLFNLFTQQDQAWARSGVIDRQIVNAIRKSSLLMVQGVAKDGRKYKDKFDAAGAEKAYKAIIKACGIT